VHNIIINNKRLVVGRFGILLFAVCCLLLVSCNRTGMGKPSERLLSKQEVEDMVLEIYLIEAKSSVLVFNMPLDSVRVQLNYEMKDLFKRYNTTYTQFKSSYLYYMGNASVSKKMIANITNRLIVLETEQTKNDKPIN